MSTPHPPAAYFPAPSEYAEYQELMAEDRRRRALDAAGQTRVLPSIQISVNDQLAPALRHFRQRVALGIDQHLQQEPLSADLGRPIPRADRRAIGRLVAQMHASRRRARRSQVDANRTYPVIKKGLNR